MDNQLYSENWLDYTAWKGTREMPWVYVSVQARSAALVTEMICAAELAVNALATTLLLIPYGCARALPEWSFSPWIAQTFSQKYSKTTAASSILAYSTLAIANPGALSLFNLTEEHIQQTLAALRKDKQTALAEFEQALEPFKAFNEINEMKQHFSNVLNGFDMVALQKHKKGALSEYQLTKSLLSDYVQRQIGRIPTDHEQMPLRIAFAEMKIEGLKAKLEKDRVRILNQNSLNQNFNRTDFNLWFEGYSRESLQSLNEQLEKLKDHAKNWRWTNNNLWAVFNNKHLELMNKNPSQLFNS